MGTGQGSSPHQFASERGSQEAGGSGSLTAATSDELAPVLARCEFPLAIWTVEDGVIRLANDAFAEMLNRPLTELIGVHLFDRVKPRESVQAVVKEFAAGRLDKISAPRQLVRDGEPDLPVRVWSRAFSLDGLSGGISLLMPISEIGRLGQDPVRPWRTLVWIAVGVIDSTWTIQAVSCDVDQVLGLSPEECVGQSFLSFVHPDDVSVLLRPEGGPPTVPVLRPDLRFRRGDGGWTFACAMFAPATTPGAGERVCFALLGSLAEERIVSVERLEQLELRLRRIAAEVRAAGVLDNVSQLRNLQDHAQLRELTTRQWEILNLLVQGQRVPAIARMLYLSPSTVRNHLATIFRKFGVHSQSELLDLIRRTSLVPPP